MNNYQKKIIFSVFIIGISLHSDLFNKNITKQDKTEDLSLEYNPVDLVSPYRFDVLAKYIYAKHWLLQVKSPWAKDIYAQHIQVWNNFFEHWPTKKGIAQFLASFHAVLEAFKNNTFNSEKSPVFIDEKGILSNGSHRLAAALAFNQTITARCYTKWKAFHATANFFKNYKRHVKTGLQEKYLDAMAIEYCLLKKNTYIALFFPVVNHDEKLITRVMEKYGIIVHKKTIQLTKSGSYNLIRQIYDGAPWLGNWSNNFAGARGAAKKRFPEGSNMVHVYIFECQNLDTIRDCKKELRALLKHDNESVHMNDTHTETVELAQTFFNENSLHFLNYSKPQHFKTFEKLFLEFNDWIKQKKINPECFCIDSSAVLAAYGIRDCRDLDLLHHGYKEELIDFNHNLIGTHNTFVKYYNVGLDDIIFNPQYHFYYKGIKFVSLPMLKIMKKNRKEKKDLNDLKLIENHLNQFTI